MTTSAPSPFGPVRIGRALPELQCGLQRMIEDGWTQHAYRDGSTGAFCSLGAMHYSSDGLERDSISLLARAIRESGWEPQVDDESNVAESYPLWSSRTIVLLWNDEDGRTWEQVRAIWETAINIAQTFAPTPTPNVTPTK